MAEFQAKPGRNTRSKQKAFPEKMVVEVGDQIRNSQLSANPQQKPGNHNNSEVLNEDGGSQLKENM